MIDQLLGKWLVLTKIFLIEIAKLAGVPDFEPKLAGRQWKNGDESAESNGNSNNTSSDVTPAGNSH